MLLFKVTFQQMIDSFVVLQLGIRKKMLEAFKISYHRVKKGVVVAEQNRFFKSS